MENNEFRNILNISVMTDDKVNNEIKCSFSPDFMHYLRSSESDKNRFFDHIIAALNRGVDGQDIVYDD